MKVVIFGATGMVGQGVLRECLLDPDVESVFAIVRKTSLPQHDKVSEIVHQDVSDLAAIEDRLSGYDACSSASASRQRDESSKRGCRLHPGDSVRFRYAAVFPRRRSCSSQIAKLSRIEEGLDLRSIFSQM